MRDNPRPVFGTRTEVNPATADALRARARAALEPRTRRSVGLPLIALAATVVLAVAVWSRVEQTDRPATLPLAHVSLSAERRAGGRRDPGPRSSSGRRGDWPWPSLPTRASISPSRRLRPDPGRRDRVLDRPEAPRHPGDRGGGHRPRDLCGRRGNRGLGRRRCHLPAGGPRVAVDPARGAEPGRSLTAGAAGDGDRGPHFGRPQLSASSRARGPPNPGARGRGTGRRGPRFGRALPRRRRRPAKRRAAVVRRSDPLRARGLRCGSGAGTRGPRGFSSPETLLLATCIVDAEPLRARGLLDASEGWVSGEWDRVADDLRARLEAER